MHWTEASKKAIAIRDESVAKLPTPLPSLNEILDGAEELPYNVTKLPRKFLSEEQVLITETDPLGILEKVRNKKWTAVKVTEAFLRRAGLGQLMTNCVTELLPERSLERARYLDDYLAEHGKPIGPLHGLPISVKEHINMKGLTMNAGFCAWVDNVAADDALLLKILWDAGAVFHARTTEPQTCMHLECHSNLLGLSVNPFNRGLSCGGSSGGEGALIGIRGSCLGIGSDIGGSIRSPAANQGLYGLRPTTYRVPWGLTNAFHGEEGVLPVIGPLSTTLSGIEVFMKTVLASKPWVKEPSLVPIPWRGDIDFLEEVDDVVWGGKKLTVGVMYTDGVVTPHPPIQRAIRELVGKLEDLPGITVKEWKGYMHEYAWDIVSSLYFSDGGKMEYDIMAESNEPILPMTKYILEGPNVKHHTITQVWDWTVKREDYREKYAELWEEMGIDVLICPVAPCAAPKFDTTRWWGYTSLFNVLDYPSLTFPVTKVMVGVDKKEDGGEGGYKALNERDEYNWGLWDPEAYRNSPVCLQIVGRKFDDEKIVQALSHIIEKTGLPFVDIFESDH